MGVPIAEKTPMSWASSVSSQWLDGALLDVVVVDETENPSAGYLADLRAWVDSRPLYPQRLRLLRFGPDQRRYFTSAREFLIGKFLRWRSYDALILLGPDLHLPAHGVVRLWEADGLWVKLAGAELLRRELLENQYSWAKPIEVPT